MNNVAFLSADDERVALGPATVTTVRADSVELRLARSGRVVRATVALAVPYEPTVGDVVLAIGDGSDHYVIGVIRGSGRTELALHGQVDLRAIDGKLRLIGDRGVEIEGPEVSVRAGKIVTLAETILERATSVVRHVRELLAVRAGETHTVVDGPTFAQSKSCAIVAEENVTVNGKGIYLG